MLRRHTHEDGSFEQVLLATNDNWSSQPEVASVRAAMLHKAPNFKFAEGSKDAALLLTLPAGVYTAQLSGGDDLTGPGQIEIYVIED